MDKQIRKLDADLARFEAEIKEQSANSASKTSETPKYRRLHIYAIVSDYEIRDGALVRDYDIRDGALVRD